MPIWVNPDARRRGDSAPRYAACLGATTIGAYVAMHRAYTAAQGVSNKPPRNDLLWALQRGDIRPVDGPNVMVRRARAPLTPTTPPISSPSAVTISWSAAA